MLDATWRKAIRSADSANCVEVRRIDAMTMDGQWRKATKSNNNGACAQVRRVGGFVEVRDSKQEGRGPILAFTPEEWDAFLDGARKGEFDLA